MRNVSDTETCFFTEAASPAEGATPAEGAPAEGAPAEGAPGKLCCCCP